MRYIEERVFVFGHDDEAELLEGEFAIREARLVLRVEVDELVDDVQVRLFVIEAESLYELLEVVGHQKPALVGVQVLEYRQYEHIIGQFALLE